MNLIRRAKTDRVSALGTAYRLQTALEFVVEFGSDDERAKAEILLATVNEAIRDMLALRRGDS